jgi:predicted Rossmann-fold nucleotide-binding protein
MLEKENNVSPEDMHLLKVVDTADEAVKYIEEFYKSHELRPNF